MSLIRAVPVRNFLDTALSTADVTTGSALSTEGPQAGQRLYAGLHLTAASTERTLGMSIQAASSSGFGTLTTEISFTLSSMAGSTWQTLTAPSTDQPWRRARWTLSTAASTGGSWNGLVWLGFK